MLVDNRFWNTPDFRRLLVLSDGSGILRMFVWWRKNERKEGDRCFKMKQMIKMTLIFESNSKYFLNSDTGFEADYICDVSKIAYS